jgi:TolB protein
MKSNNTMLWGSLLLLLMGRAHAILEIEITQGVEGALPIAVSPFKWQGRDESPPVEIAAIVTADLQRSGQFSLFPQAQFPQHPAFPEEINFPLWRNLGVENIVLGSTTQQGADRYIVKFQLFDAIRGGSLIGYSIPAAERDLRKVAHKISDLIFEKLTGKRGAFSSRVAYVSVLSLPGDQKQYVLQVADSDGYNPRTVYTSAHPLMSPAWSPDGERLAYVSFENGHSEVFVQHLRGGHQTKVSGKAGINSAPAWSPDGRKLALVLSVDGNPDIYVIDVSNGRIIKRVTRNSSIDTEPAWMPDGKSMVFTSDRSGQPQLYQVSLSGGRAKRLTFEGNYNAAADVSPDGLKIAMVHNNGRGFRIAVRDNATRTLRVLTDGSLDESPSFAPNGSMIIYATANAGRGVLSAVSEDGRFHQRLTLQEGDVREPVWSPYRD